LKTEDLLQISEVKTNKLQIGINTWMAAQYIQDKNDGRNVTLLSATPFTNKPLNIIPYYHLLLINVWKNRVFQCEYFL
jgi:N12 class adenine-specific DNA methylase